MSHLLLEDPLLLFLILLAACYPLLRLLGTRRPSLLSTLSVSCGLLSIAVFLFVTLMNVDPPAFVWQDEANILAITAAFVHGAPMYHALTAPALYSLLYGPSTFLVYAPPLALSAHPAAWIWLSLSAVRLATLLLLYRITRTLLPRFASLALLPLATAVLLSIPNALLGTRGDIWLLFCIAFALWSALRSDRLVAAVASGLLAGVAIDFKLTVAPVILLMLGVLYRKHGPRTAILSGVAAAVCALSIFLLPGISLPNYLAWLVLASHQGLVWFILVDNLLLALFLIAPALLLRLSREGPRTSRQIGWVLPALYGTAIIGCVVTGAKNGAGRWHLWPVLPFMLLATAYDASPPKQDAHSPLSWPPRVLGMMAAIALTATALTVRYGLRNWHIIGLARQPQQRARQRQAEEELDRLVHRYPGRSLQIGYGSSPGDYRSNLRYKLVLQGNDYFFDGNAVIEAIKVDMPIPTKVVQRITGCADLWLVPRGELPFSTLRMGVLPDHDTPYLFPDAIRKRFAETHTRVAGETFYDVWGCP